MTVTNLCESLAPTPAFIEAIRDNKLVQRFAQHPSTLATYRAIQATQAGFGLIYRMERDNAYGRELVQFLLEVFQLVVWPLLALALNGIAIMLRYLCSKRFRYSLTDAHLWVLDRFNRQSTAQPLTDLSETATPPAKEVI